MSNYIRYDRIRLSDLIRCVENDLGRPLGEFPEIDLIANIEVTPDAVVEWRDGKHYERVKDLALRLERIYKRKRNADSIS